MSFCGTLPYFQGNRITFFAPPQITNLLNLDQTIFFFIQPIPHLVNGLIVCVRLFLLLDYKLPWNVVHTKLMFVE